MESPRIRPGRVQHESSERLPNVVADFPNSAQGNAVIQLLLALGVPSDRIGVIPPEQTGRSQGMILSIGIPSADLATRVEAVCRAQGATVYASQVHANRTG